MSKTDATRQQRVSASVVIGGLALFALAFLVIDQAYFRFLDARFPSVGESWVLATAWGVVARLHVLVPVALIAIRRPGFLGLQRGRLRTRWRTIAVMLLVNCGVVAAFLLLTGATPYGGDHWLVTEVITVPVIEELVWRGLVLGAVLELLRRAGSGKAVHLAVWSTGVVFGALHLSNVFAGVPPSFVAIQAASAMAWGVLYGYARTESDSIYAPMLLHAAMNATVVLLS